MRDAVASPQLEAPPWGIALLLALFGLALRLVHNAALLESPLYSHPLGGHVVFLKDAAAILGGDWLPGSRPFVENSPLYPYLLALEWAAFGASYLATRLCTILADAGTVALVTVLAWRHFGRRAAVVAGVLYAVYAPAIFFATELIYTPYAVLLSTLAAWWIDDARPGRALAAGLASGLAIALMPSLMLAVPLLVLTPFVVRQARPVGRAALVVAGVAAGIAPVTVANYVNSGQVVLLTTGFGHAFYIGHNPLAQAGYHLPNRIGPVTFSNRGSIFDNMKAVASTVEGRELADSEVSPWFTRKALEQMRAHPGFEATLAAKRLAALANTYEATTYGDFYFGRQVSPVLHAALTFEWLLPLAVLGMIGADLRKRMAILTPVCVGIATVLTFFFLARFRMPMIPMLCVFAGRGVVELVTFARAQAWRPVVPRLAAATALVVVARIAWVPYDSANEWNKVGAVWMSLGKLGDAETAFEHARAENPRDPNAYLNLARLYDQRGDTTAASEIRRMGARQLRGDQGDQFRRELSATQATASHL